MGVDGHFFRGGRSTPLTARLQAEEEQWLVTLDGETCRFAMADTRISARLARVPRRLEFPGDAQFTTADNAGIDRLLAAHGRAGKASLVHRMESRWAWAIAALVAVPACLWVLFTWGLPVLSAPIARAVPDPLLAEIDESVLEVVDSQWLGGSTLPVARRTEVRNLLHQQSWGQGLTLRFRAGGAIGANALALPGGTVILTDELIELVEHDGELVAVLAHEAGHVEGRHALRNIVQSAGAAAILGWVVGDLSFVVDIALVGAPAMIQQLSYTRGFERDADRYALYRLTASGYAAACFGDIMRKLQDAAEISDDTMPGFLQTHPPTAERIAAGSGEAACGATR